MRIGLVIAAATLAIGAAAAQASPSPARGEAKLNELLQGRVAGEPVDCLRLQNIRSTRIVDDTAILYTTTDGTIYVNRPRSGARTLDQWDVLVTKPFGSRLCSIDIVRLYSSTPWMQTGFVGLGEFVPYRKPDAHD